MASLRSGRPVPELVEDLVVANRILYQQGVVDGFGHISVRHDKDKSRFLMSRSLAPALVTADDIMEFDLDANAIDKRDRKVYLERFIHGEIYRARPDVRCVVHSHSPTVVPFGVSATPLRPLAQVSGFLGLGVPVFEIRKFNDGCDFLISDAGLGKALAQVLGDKAVVLMRGHGSTAVGNTLRQAVWRAIYTEVNARQQVVAMLLGPVIYLNPEESRYAADNVPQDPDRAWNLWKHKALSDPKC